MSKNKSNHNHLPFKDDNQKLLETEQRLINEGIIFKSRLLNHKKEAENPSIKRNYKKDLSVKLNDKNPSKKHNGIYSNNIPISSKGNKKLSFTKFNHISENNNSKESIKKNNKKDSNKNINNILKHNSYKGSSKYKNKSHQKSLNFVLNYNDKIIHRTGNTSPRISNIYLENGLISPIERYKYQINTYRDIENGNEQQEFNYKKWNKIIINNIFDKEKKKSKENTQKSIKDDIYKNENGNGIQEIIVNNIKKQKIINDIPKNKEKNKTKKKNITKSKGNIIERNNLFNYNKQISNLALSKDNKSNYIGQTLNGLKCDYFGSPYNINKMPEKNNIYKNNKIKKNKSANKKSKSSEKINSYIPKPHYFSFKELDLKNHNKKVLSKNNYLNLSNLSPKSNANISINSNNNKIDNENNLNYINNNKKKEALISQINTQIIKIKNNKLMQYIKADDANNLNLNEEGNNDTNINKNKEIVFNKEKVKDLNEVENITTKNDLFSEEIFNSNTDLFTEKDKGYTFDNKLEIDNTESSIKIINNCNNNIFDNNNTTTFISKNISKDYPYSPKNNIFTKKIIGCVNIKPNNKNNINNKSNININNNINNNLIEQNYNNKENKIDEKEVIFNIKTDNNYKNNDNIIDNNKKNDNNNKEYMELAKICANQEKIISDLVRNVQQLNSQICDKDLCINELNNQLYSIKYDLLNTLQKTNNNK